MQALNKQGVEGRGNMLYVKSACLGIRRESVYPLREKSHFEQM